MMRGTTSQSAVPNAKTNRRDFENGVFIIFAIARHGTTVCDYAPLPGEHKPDCQPRIPHPQQAIGNIPAAGALWTFPRARIAPIAPDFEQGGQAQKLRKAPSNQGGTVFAGKEIMIFLYAMPPWSP